MKLTFYFLLIIISFSSCLPDKPTQQNTVEHTPVLSSENQTNKTNVLKTGSDETSSVEPTQDNTTQNKKTAKLGTWKLSKTFDKPNIKASSVELWRNKTILVDREKDSIHIINLEDDNVTQSLYVSEPMYVKHSKGRLMIPSLGDKTIYVFRGKELYPLESFTELEGPVAVDAFSINHYMMLDQIKGQFIYKNEEVERIIGKGVLSNPTNFIIHEMSTFYILDNGNKLVRVFNDKGDELFSFGQEQSFDNITGITSDETRIFVSDFDKGTIYVYDFDGQYLGALTENINSPIDLEIRDGILYVANQNGSDLVSISELPED